MENNYPIFNNYPFRSNKIVNLREFFLIVPKGTSKVYLSSITPNRIFISTDLIENYAYCPVASYKALIDNPSNLFNQKGLKVGYIQTNDILKHTQSFSIDETEFIPTTYIEENLDGVRSIFVRKTDGSLIKIKPNVVIQAGQNIIVDSLDISALSTPQITSYLKSFSVGGEIVKGNSINITGIDFIRINGSEFGTTIEDINLCPIPFEESARGDDGEQGDQGAPGNPGEPFIVENCGEIDQAECTCADEPCIPNLEAETEEELECCCPETEECCTPVLDVCNVEDEPILEPIIPDCEALDTEVPQPPVPPPVNPCDFPSFDELDSFTEDYQTSTIIGYSITGLNIGTTLEDPQTSNEIYFTLTFGGMSSDLLTDPTTDEYLIKVSNVEVLFDGEIESEFINLLLLNTEKQATVGLQSSFRIYKPTSASEDLFSYILTDSCKKCLIYSSYDLPTGTDALKRKTYIVLETGEIGEIINVRFSGPSNEGQNFYDTNTFNRPTLQIFNLTNLKKSNIAEMFISASSTSLSLPHIGTDPTKFRFFQTSFSQSLEFMGLPCLLQPLAYSDGNFLGSSFYGSWYKEIDIDSSEVTVYKYQTWDVIEQFPLEGKRTSPGYTNFPIMPDELEFPANKILNGQPCMITLTENFSESVAVTRNHFYFFHLNGYFYHPAVFTSENLTGSPTPRNFTISEASAGVSIVVRGLPVYNASTISTTIRYDSSSPEFGFFINKTSSPIGTAFHENQFSSIVTGNYDIASGFLTTTDPIVVAKLLTSKFLQDFPNALVVEGFSEIFILKFSQAVSLGVTFTTTLPVYQNTLYVDHDFTINLNSRLVSPQLQKYTELNSPNPLRHYRLSGRDTSAALDPANITWTIRGYTGTNTTDGSRWDYVAGDNSNPEGVYTKISGTGPATLTVTAQEFID